MSILAANDVKLLANSAFRALGPAIPPGSPREAVRAGIGALIGVALAGLLLLTFTEDQRLGLWLIAPFGATSVLVFAVPSSPLAQPWSAVVGNTLSALCAVLVCMLVADPFIRVPLAVGLAIAAMILLRALHPPGGAVAMTAALSPDTIRELGLGFALCPVALGTAILVLVAVLYSRLTGRHYPFRQFEQKNVHGTDDHEPLERIGLTEAELTDILTQYRQTLNLGVEDLVRLISAAELRAAGHRAGPLTASDIMSRDLVTVGPETVLNDVAQLFQRHGFISLPVVEKDDRFLGVIYQIHLIRKAADESRGIGGMFRAVLARQLRDRRLRAAQIMSTDVPTTTPDAPIATLLPKLADGSCDAVPVLDGGRIVGIVTRTDLIAALARQSLRQPA